MTRLSTQPIANSNQFAKVFAQIRITVAHSKESPNQRGEEESSPEPGEHESMGRPELSAARRRRRKVSPLLASNENEHTASSKSKCCCPSGVSATATIIAIIIISLIVDCCPCLAAAPMTTPSLQEQQQGEFRAPRFLLRSPRSPPLSAFASTLRQPLGRQLRRRPRVRGSVKWRERERRGSRRFE